MYYRGSGVSTRERESRVRLEGVVSRSRFGAGRNPTGASRKEKGRPVFLKLFGANEKSEVHRPPKAYAFYRPGVTQSEENKTGRKGLDTPAFSKGEGTWALRAPALKGAKWILRAAGVVLLVGAVIWSKQRTTALLQDVAGLKLGKVSVEGNHYLTEDEVARAVALPLGENMFKLDLQQAVDRVRKLDWVDRVFVERRLPSSILISIRERKPVALLDNGNIYGVDREGRILSSAPALLGEDLPLISGLAVGPEAVGTTRMAESLKPALDFFDFLRANDPVLAQDVSEVNLSEPDSLKVTFIDGIQATFNAVVSAEELKRMALVLSDLNQKGKRAGTMDFRYKDMVLVKTR